MRIEITSDAPADWDEFVSGHTDFTAYHRSSAILVGRDVFNLNVYFITARNDDGAIVGALPLVEQSSLIFGRFLTSLPFVNYGGLLSSHDDAGPLLADAASKLAQQRNAKHVELRHKTLVASLHLEERLDKVSMQLDLPDNQESLASQLGSKLRSQIRRAERENPEVIWGGKELVPEFYAVYAPGMQALGTPVYPRRFFDVFMDAMGDLVSIIVVRINGKPEAIALTVRHKHTIEVSWAVATIWAKKNAVNMRMYWELLSEAINQGATTFDFGRCTIDSGTYRFKAQWGAKPRQLRWHYWLPEGASIPRLNQANPKYALAVWMWQKMPLWCANILGPRISRYVP